MPRLQEIPPGCPFHPRCPEAFDRCQVERPDLMDTGHPKQIASCWKFAGKT
jgi:peptide/nickel transport system ATP-binding protein